MGEEGRGSGRQCAVYVLRWNWSYERSGLLAGEVECQHCGNTIRTKRPDLRKWCDRCRILRDIPRLREKVWKCVVCKRPYYAHDSGSARAATRLCPDCSGTPAGETRDTDKCAFCDRGDRLLPGVALCYICATDASNEKRSAQVVMSVVRKLKDVARGD